MLADYRAMVTAHRRAGLTGASPEALAAFYFESDKVAAPVRAIGDGVLAEAQEPDQHALSARPLDRLGELLFALNLDHRPFPSFGIISN